MEYRMIHIFWKDEIRQKQGWNKTPFELLYPVPAAEHALFFVYKVPLDRYGIMNLSSLNRFGDGCSVIVSYYFHPKLAIDVWYSLYIYIK